MEVQSAHPSGSSQKKPQENVGFLWASLVAVVLLIAAYSHLLDTVGMPETEYSAFLHYKEMKNKYDYMQQFNTGSKSDIARTLAMFGAFTEGLQLFASFAILLNFPRFNKMKGMGQIVSWSARDESLHTESIIRLFNSNETNPNNAQLVFTTHDTNLLTNKLFRRDQIWFTEKNKYGATDLYSLAEIKNVRSDASFEKDYITGRYGAIPFVGGLHRLIGGGDG